MNLGAVLLAWNLARQQAALHSLKVSPSLTMLAERQLAGWKPGTNPEPAFSNYGMVAAIWQGSATPAWVAADVLNAPYHRATVLGAFSSEGVAEATVGDWHAVLAIFGGSAPMPAFDVWMPPSVPAAWTNDEMPAPFGLAQGVTTGWPIAILNQSGPGYVKGAAISGPGGVVPSYLNEEWNGDWSALVMPKAPLTPGAYTLRFWWCGGPKARLVKRTFIVG